MLRGINKQSFFHEEANYTASKGMKAVPMLIDMKRLVGRQH